MRAELLLPDVPMFLILWDVVQIVNILNSYVEVCLVNELDLVQDLQTDLGIHHCERLLVGDLAGHKKVGLLQLVD